MAEHLDKEGFATLEVISQADNFNTWMFETLRPFIGGKVFEAGSGIGNISGLLLQHASSVMLSDHAGGYTELLRTKFMDVTGFEGVLDMDLADPLFDEKFSGYFGVFDTVVALNVIEHIGDDGRAVANCWKLLKPGGKMVILVPAFGFFYNRFDKELGHFRRYTRRSLRLLMESVGGPGRAADGSEARGGAGGGAGRVLHTAYFNLAGIAGWVLSGSVMRKRIIPSGQMRIFNWLVPLFRRLDMPVRRFLGLSVWAVGEKDAPPAARGDG